MNNPADAPSRDDALDTNRSFHVESPAGSGKTMLLTTRFVKLLAESGHPSEILALTYTEKAALEMRTRIVDALRRAKESAPPTTPADKELLSAAEEALRHHRDRFDLLSSSSSLNIMTFHGFCHYLAARAPLEARLNPDFEVADDNMGQLLARESVTLFIDRLYKLARYDARRKALENRALYHDNNWRALTEELVGIIQKRDRFLDLVGIIMDSGTINMSLFEERLRERVRFYVERRLSELAGVFAVTSLGRRWKSFTAHLAQEKCGAAENLPLILPGASWEDLSNWNSIADCLLTKAGTVRKTLGQKTGFYPGFMKSEWGNLVTELSGKTARLLHEATGYPQPGQ
ncbi:MAG: UvrD-helicase domain-containing protein, partial [Syntrophales bacterium]|nr:UvrD-helicase domain-containing protein [Syntrophales bacterium]